MGGGLGLPCQFCPETDPEAFSPLFPAFGSFAGFSITEADPAFMPAAFLPPLAFRGAWSRSRYSPVVS